MHYYVPCMCLGFDKMCSNDIVFIQSCFACEFSYQPNFSLKYATFWLYIQNTYMVYKQNMFIKTLVHVY
jgi:hypothetical protein